MFILVGPHCFVCGGSNVVRKRVYGNISWSTQGVKKGWYETDVCLDCEQKIINKEA